jgi:uncharacterized SAM-binding protein YcdF (DUF218 family)
LDTVFFVVAKLAGVALKVETWLLLAALAAFWAGLRNRVRLQHYASGILVAALLGIGFFPLGDVMLGPIEARIPAPEGLGPIDGIIVLGGGEDMPASHYWARPELGEGGDRHIAALALARRHPEARVLFTGGSGRLRDAGSDLGGGGVMTEAEIARQILTGQGIAPERLLFESRSRNTAENARFGHALVSPGADERWALITSAFHMPRAVQSFAAAGWADVIPVPVDYRSRAWADGLGWNLPRNLTLMNKAIREWFGQSAYAAAGR